METGRAAKLHPAHLPKGTLVEGWRVEGWGGRGTYGVVYSAVRVGQERSGPIVALKVAVHHQDPRFAREAALLSRIHHPGVPALIEHGQWANGEKVHPYLVMEWVEGVPLYEWSSARNPTSREVLKLLAQLAQALAAIHEAGVVHRDVKGDNIRVCVEDGRAFLMDLGSGQHEGAEPLTDGPLPPNTPAYRSPEAWRFACEQGREPGAHYEAQPADDIFALGVTAYRLVTDEYPPSTEPKADKEGLWREGGPGPRPPQELNPRVEPWLSALILRMLSVRPEHRGCARELADFLEQELECADEQAALPLFAWEKQPPNAWSREESAAALELGHRPRRRRREVVEAAEEQDRAARARRVRRRSHASARESTPPMRARLRSWQSTERVKRLPLFVGALVILGLAALYRPSIQGIAIVRVEPGDGGARDGGTAELAREVLSARVEPGELLEEEPGLTLEVPKNPLPGQRLTDGSGKCRYEGEVAINGSCWILVGGVKPPCPEIWYEWKEACYAPSFRTSKPPASEDPP
jgi:predicted Ser/Thr protein kinase